MAGLLIAENFITCQDLAPLLDGPTRIRLSRRRQQDVRAAHLRLEELLARNTPIYGVTTGFGHLSQVAISPRDRRQLQLNLVRSHAAGVGKNFDPGFTRLVLGLKLLTLTRGYSGVRPELVEQLLNFLRHDILPLIPRQGSVGASGDLAPMAHLALGLIGEGMVHFQDRIIPAMLALKETGLQPLVLEPKEGLSLVNGTQVSTALGVKAVLEAEKVLKTADIAAALSVEASLSSRAIFKRSIHRLKRHPGQRLVARNIWNCLQNSSIVQSHYNCERIQDPYSIRCIPHVHGTSRDIYSAVRKMVENEINSISDNPLILKNGELVNSGHFHAEPVAQALDSLTLALAEIGAISERRTHFSMKGIDDRVPPFGAHDPGLESGFMLSHVTAAALASENKTLAHPASVDSLPTSGGQEDFVSMAPWAGRKCLRVLKNVVQILAIEILVAGNAISVFHRGLDGGKGTQGVMNLLRRHIRFAQGDHPYHEDIATISNLIQAGKIIHSVARRIALE